LKVTYTNYTYLESDIYKLYIPGKWHIQIIHTWKVTYTNYTYLESDIYKLYIPGKWHIQIIHTWKVTYTNYTYLESDIYKLYITGKWCLQVRDSDWPWRRLLPADHLYRHVTHNRGVVGHCSGSVTFWYESGCGSGTSNPYLWQTDPNADPHPYQNLPWLRMPKNLFSIFFKRFKIVK
jgi:hypothetical protein